MLKITDESEKWHFLARPSILDEDDVKRPTRCLSRIMEGISSKSKVDFYCHGCLHSFCTQSTLKNHVELCKYNKFWKIELPKGVKNIKQYVPGTNLLKMNSVIYVDFESILLPYSTCDKENVTTKKLNKHVPCGYSINVVTNHDKKTKQVRDIVQNLINIEKKSMQEQLQEQPISHDNSQFCHIRKKVFGKKKKHVKVRDHDHYTGKYRGAAHVTCNLR